MIRFAASIFVLGIAIGLMVNDRSWNGQVFVYVGEQRAPAAVRSLGEYSSLDRKALYRAAHVQLMADARMVRDGGRLGVQLGHPLLSRKGGGKEFGCQVQDRSGAFDRIELVFVGVGISAGGEAPRMTVDANCRAQGDLNRLETVWIPIGEIFASPPRDQELQVPGENPMNVKLDSIPDQWPDNWVLWSVRLYRDGSPNESLTVDANQLREVHPKLMSFDWKPE